MLVSFVFSVEGLSIIGTALLVMSYSRHSSIYRPWYTKISNIWYNYRLATGTHVPMVTDFHRQYGPIVRLGHNVIYNTHKYIKGPFYEGFHFANVENRRRLIRPAFAMSAINEMEDLVQTSGIHALVHHLNKHADGKQVINMHQIHSFMTFDIMSKLTFGKSFNMLEEGHHPYTSWMHSFLMLGIYKAGLGSLAHPKLFPGLYAAEKNMSDFAHAAIKRRQSESARPDILQRLMDAKDEETEHTLSEDELAAELIAMLVGGSDTTSTALTWVLYHLLQHPGCMKRLQAELDEAFPDPNGATPIIHDATKDLVYLNAVLHESFRLHPVSAGDPQRIVPPEGTYLCGHFIPGGCILVPQIYALQHLEKYWSGPEEYKPERWLVPSEEQKIMKRAFIAFSHGVRSCVGSNLAWLEMRLGIATMIRYFDFTFVPGADMTPKQQFTYSPTDRKLEVTIIPRKI
ncbi:cytochrome P450 [Syncephalis plumigaleata]|nr:cytochrome P450 [Syncephalis plumigaleata]